MKKCEDIEQKLTAYLEGFLSGKDRGLVEEHLRDCPDCSRALDDLKRTKAMLEGLDEVEPPPWLAARIMSQINEESEAKVGFFRKLFLPLHIKIPVQALAAVCVIALSILVYHATIPDMKSIQHKLPEAQVSMQRPVDAAGPVQRPSVLKAPPAKTGRQDIRKKTGPRIEAGAAEGLKEKLQAQPSPHISPVPQDNVEFSPSMKEGAAGAAQRPETYGVKTAIPEDTINNAPSTLKGESRPAEKMKIDKNIGAGVMMKEEEAKKRIVTRSARSAPTQPPHHRIAIVSDTPPKTSRMAIEILISLGSKDINEIRLGDATVITCSIDRRNMDLLVDKLEKIGNMQGEHTPVDTQTGRIIIEISISNAGEDRSKPHD